MSAPRDAALDYAGRGWAVFPCARKVPRTGHGVRDATTNPTVIAGWWERWPETNVGIATGAVSGLFALDVDGEPGADSLADLEREQGALPRTRSVTTPSGGQHFYFRHPGGTISNSSGRLGAGLDIRGDGGYVVAPPSTGYELDEALPVAAAPAWLLDLIRDSGRRTTAPVGETIPAGRRNDVLTSLAGTMRRRGFCEEAIRAALLAENRTKCAPPLPEAEVGKIAESVARSYEPGDPVLRTGGSDSLVPCDTGATTGDDEPEMRYLLREHEAGRLEPEPVELGPMPEDATAAMRAVVIEVAKRIGLQRAVDDDGAIRFSCREAADAVEEIKNYKHAWRVLHRLRKAGVIEHVGNDEPRNGHRQGTALYAPPSLPSDVPKVAIPVATGGVEAGRGAGDIEGAQPLREVPDLPLVADAEFGAGRLDRLAAFKRHASGTGASTPAIKVQGHDASVGRAPATTAPRDGDDRTPFCTCRRPARSPRADGPAFCQTCKRPIRETEPAHIHSGQVPTPSLSADARPPDDLSDLASVEQPLPAVPPAMARAGSPRTCRCDRPEPWRDEDGELICRKCGFPAEVES